MQAQTTRARRFTFNPLIVLALAAAILLATGTLAAADVVDLPFTSEREAVTSSSSHNAQDAAHRQIERKFQLPRVDFGPRTQTSEQMRFLEQNLYLPGGVIPLPLSGPAGGRALSIDRMIFLEQNIWEYAGLPATDPPISYPAGQLE